MRNVVQRISGSHDMRMVPVAAGMWAGCLVGRWCWKDHTLNALIIAMACGVITCVIVKQRMKISKCFQRFQCFQYFQYFQRFLYGNSASIRIRIHNYSQRIFRITNTARYWLVNWRKTMSLATYVCIAAIMLTYTTQCVLANDIVMQSIQTSGVPNVQRYHRTGDDNDIVASENEAEFTIITPLRTSKSMSGDCQATVQVRKFARLASYARAKLYAYSPLCNRLAYGATVRVPVRVGTSRFNSDVPEFRIAKSQATIRITEQPDIFHRTMSALWQSFYEVTNKLDMQGRMLVPGVTVGMLGQEYVPIESEPKQAADSTQAELIDETYATMTRRHFQHAGIMHVMAVSGGHFLLLAVIIRRCCAYFLTPRWFTAFVQIVLQIMLACIVFPSASVLRALIMGVISAVALCSKRPYQSVSALSWTIILVLFMSPSYAWDYAFALSCAATFGIVTMGVPLSRVFDRYMPSWIAAALSMTLTAQYWTLPVQILIQPEVSCMSVLANVVVAPLMDWATLCGLISLVCASCNAGLSFVFAQLASLGTDFMQQCAYWCDDTAIGVVPWASGVGGAWLMVAVEVAILLVGLGVRRMLSQRYVVNRMIILGQLLGSSGKRIISDATEVFEN